VKQPSRTLNADRSTVTIPALRWWIGAALFASTIINYIDRQTLSLLAPYLKVDYHWSNTDYAYLVIAFRLAYSIGQTVMGRLIDRNRYPAGIDAHRRGLLADLHPHSACQWVLQFRVLPLSPRGWRIGKLAGSHQGGL